MTYNQIKMLLGLAIILFLTPLAYSQTLHFNLKWDRSNASFPGKFDGAQEDFYARNKYYPIWAYTELTGQDKFEATLSNEIYEPVSANAEFMEYLPKIKLFEIINAEERGQIRLKIKIVPFRIVNQQLERLVSFDIKLNKIGKLQNHLNKKGNTTLSVLASGEWYKLKISDDGVYKMDKSFFAKNSINTSAIDLRTFKVYGNGGHMLPEIIADPSRVDDLIENTIQVFDGNSNNQMDDGDFILFYGKGPSLWEERETDYLHVKNVFSDYAYYFITWGGLTGKRIGESGSGEGLSNAVPVTESDYLYVHEVDEVNFRNSGREWFGEVLTIERKSFDVSVPDIVSSPGNFVRSEVACRTAIERPVNVYLDGNLFISHYTSTVNFESDDNYAGISNQKRIFTKTTPFNLTYEFIRPQISSEAWINYFEVQCKRKLKPVNGQIHLFNLQAKNSTRVKFTMEEFNSDYTLWDVTDFRNINVQKTYNEGDKSVFIINTGGKLPRYLVFKNGSEKIPELVQKIENQNLHGLSPVDFIIITHPDFKAQAEKLAKFHEEREGYTYLITYPEKIYNEFSSGALDITAIRNFVKMIYDRADPGNKPKALLLLGDASFDYKNRNNGNGNFVPTFESYEYNNSVSSYCSDDYYVILGDDEGYWPKKTQGSDENMDMGVGRLPAKSSYDADVMVDKCIHYKTNSNKGEWRCALTLLGDDEDGDIHFKDSEKLADLCEKEFPPLNITKIYLDAYKQVSLGNGNAYPDVNDAINNTLAKGTLLFNYLGHGGGSGMAHERVISRPMITSWKNYDRLCFFVTGTCDLAQFDNPKEDSPGELMMSNDVGGAIGMMTTTRKVYIGLNTYFSETLFSNNLFKHDGNHYTTFGQAYVNVKNVMVSQENVRNYVMLGDPLLDLNLPSQKTQITSINGKAINSNSKDTLKALTKVEIEGRVTDNSDIILSDFNGDVAITLFDKKQTYKTLANDPGSSVQPFSVRNNVLYRGKASVKNGLFKVSFILPKDIDYTIGKGRIFTYAFNEKTDAVGNYDSAYVGGTGNKLENDITGPRIEVYLEDEKFVNGGIVSKNPLLIVKLWDENGINTAGNGVGREILGVLDKGTENSKNYILNDFYSTTLDSYQGGEVRIRLADIAPGKHVLIVRGWDVYNNSNENQVEFVVADNENMAIKNLLNYPNPFSTKTKFLFDHNKAGQELSIAINILTVNGKVVKTIYSKIPDAPSHIDQIEWDGKDEYGEPLSRGVYLYKIKIKSEDGKTEEEIQKMVLIK